MNQILNWQAQAGKTQLSWPLWITDASAKKMITCIDPFHKFVFELIIQNNFYPQTSLT